jgi:hypothetical protein
MQFTLETDENGRLICRLVDAGIEGTVTASNVPQAGTDLLAAIEDAKTTGYGECLWEEVGGEYRWMLRADGDRLTVVVLWSIGTVTGWQHVFRAECDADWFQETARASLARA